MTGVQTCALPIYGPYADAFPLEQHKFGPFKPIDDYYKQLKR